MDRDPPRTTDEILRALEACAGQPPVPTLEARMETLIERLLAEHPELYP